ncbi:MAG: type I restriction endonuclease subunit R, partial [Halanaerobiales bacterium]
AEAQGLLNAYIDPAVERYKDRDEEEQVDFKSTLTTFVRQYSFMLQIIPFKDVDLHKLYSYGRFLLKKLPRENNSGNISLDNDVTLEYYRVEETFSGDNRISETENIKGVTHAGSGGKPEEEIENLSEIIKIFNEHFGAENFTEGDKLFVDQIQEDMMNDETLAKQAKNNTKDNFRYVFDKAFIKKAMGRMNKNQKVFAKMMNDEDFQSAIKVYLLEQVYEGLQARA